MAVLIRSPFGHTLKGIRESESRMRVLGYHTWLHKYLAYVVSAAFAGLAGVLWAYFNGFISPFDMDLNASIEIVLMVILGGPGTLIGPALGSGIIVFLKNFISAYTQRWLIILGAIYILHSLRPAGADQSSQGLDQRAAEQGQCLREDLVGCGGEAVAMGLSMSWLFRDSP